MNEVNHQLKIVEMERNILFDGTSNLTSEVTAAIGNLSLIDKSDIAALKEAQAFLLETYTDVPQFRPLTVKLTSVLTNGNFPTVDSKYWQCKVEAEVHFNELVRAYNKYEKAVIDIEEMDYKIRSIDTILNQDVSTSKEKYDPEIMKFERRRFEVKKKEYLFELKQLEKTIKYRIEEVTDWHNISKQLKDKCKYKTYDDHVIESHFEKLKFRANAAATPEEREIALDQLNTFKSMLMEAKTAVEGKKLN